MKKLLIILQLLLIACQAYAADLYVIGGDVNGNSWLLKDPSGKMTPAGSGIWEWRGETLSSGFKINDGTWTTPEYNLGSSGLELNLGKPYYYQAGSDGNILISTVKLIRNPHLTLDMNRGTILLEGDADGDAEDKYYITGTFNSWLIDSPESLMEKEGSRYVKRGLVIPSVEKEEQQVGLFKIAEPFWTNSWGRPAYSSSSDCITPQQLSAYLVSEKEQLNADMYYTISGTYDVWWDPAKGLVSFVKTGESPDDPGDVDYGSIYIIGDNVNGNHWLLGDETAKFASIGKSQYEWTGTYLGNGFKINDGTWSGNVVNGVMMNIGSNGEGLVLGKPYHFRDGGSPENIGFAEVSEVFNPVVLLDMSERTITVTADGHALTLTLPAEASDGRYKNCIIELTDNATGIKQRAIVTDRLSYTFQGIGSKNEYTLRMLTPSNVEIALLEGIKMAREEMEVAFADIKGLYPVNALVETSDGEAAESGATIEWFAKDAAGDWAYLRQGSEAGSWPAGTPLLCRVTLDANAGVKYSNPQEMELTVGEGGNTLRILLSPPAKVGLCGKVTDETGSPLEGVTVALTQLLNGKYSNTVSALTDRKGEWSLEAAQGSQAEIVFSAKDCVSKKRSIGSITSDSGALDLGTVALSSIVGAKISLAVSYKSAASSDIDSFFTDYQNLSLEVYNLTQGRVHEDISVQFPVLAVLDEGINPGDELRLTLRSLTGLFSPVEKTVALDEECKGTVEAVITGKGGIRAEFAMTDNPEVAASLYNAAGELAEKRPYAEASVEFLNLAAGKYTLLSMGRSDLMNSPLRISLLDEIGLKEGKDYLLNEVEVKDGEMTVVANDEIPDFDESPYYYTTSNSGVSSNKSSITTGNYLTLRADVDFRGAYAGNVDDVSLIFDFPEGSEFVSQSVIKGSALIPYTLEGTRLTIPLGSDWKKQVRFCVIPTVAGPFTATASLRFGYDGKEMTQPLGFASCAVKEMEITVPKVVSSPRFYVSGVTLADSEVSVYDDGALLATGKADSNGAWKVECELPKAYNLSVHPIHAEVATPSGARLTSESQTLTYDMNAIRVSKVTMYHWNPELNKTCVSEFDFLNPKTSGSQWDLYYPEKKFTYTVEFTENDPDKISNVILYVHTADGQVVPVGATFDENKKCWYATIDMGSEANAYYPVNCSIDFDYISDKKADVDETSEMIETVSELTAEYKTGRQALKEYFDSNQEVDNSTLNQLLTSLGIEAIDVEPDSDALPEGFASWGDSEQQAYLDAEYARLTQDIDALLPTLSYLETAFTDSREMEYEQDGIKFKMSSCQGLHIADPEAEGFKEMETTSGIKVYVKFEENHIIAADFANDLYIEMTFPGEATLTSRQELTFSEAAEAYSNCMTRIQRAMDLINARWNDLTEYARFPVEEIEDAIEKVSSRLKQVTCYKNMSTKDMGKKAKWALEEARLTNALSSLRMAKKIAGPVIRGILKAMPVASYFAALWDCYDKSNKIYSILTSIPDPCPEAQSEANICKATCVGLWATVGTKAIVDVVGSFTSDAAIVSGVLASFVTAATSLGATAMGAVGKTVLAIANIALDNTIDWGIRKLGDKVAALKCKKDKHCGDEGMPPCPPIPNPKPKPNGGNHPSGSSPDNPKQDPSGYVYEAVRDNRVEGVQASIYYKETKEDMYGEPYDEVMLWNAEEYAQRNPLFTDERGMYRWDVPQGLWQVKFEKEGYLTAYSDWLPVPPPQLDVNIAISQAKHPEVAEARAYEEGVEIRFDKFMKPLTLSGENIRVSAGGVALPGSIELLDEGSAEEDEEEGVKYASRVRFIPETPLGLTTGEVRLTVSPNVMSYCGVPMGEMFTQTLDVEKEVQVISAESARVLYGEEKELTVFALPSEAAAGRKLNVSAASDVIISLNAEDAAFDEEGKATIKVKGLLPGATRLFFSMPDVTATGDCDVDVVTEIIEAEAPKASRASGTEVYRGAKVELTTTSKDATIYYTLDGSCPCDADGTRRKYTVPIVITDDTQILAMTMVGNNAEDVSDVVAFNYTIKHNAMEYSLAPGWTWMSHPFERPLPAESLTAAEGVKSIMGQRGEAVGELNAAEGYKIETHSPVALPRIEDVAWSPATSIELQAGINWIGYPMTQAMSLDEAFASMKPEVSDVVVGQGGFAEFDGTGWVGTLSLMEPGCGYIYHSLSGKQLIYNRSVVSKARAQKARRAARGAEAVDIRRYRDIMPLVAVITDKGEPADCSKYELAAYSGDECRGVASVMGGRFMMNIHGTLDDEVTLVATDMNDFSEKELGKLSLREEVAGSLAAPVAFDLSNATNGIAEGGAAPAFDVEVADGAIVISGMESSRIELVKVIDMEGRAVLSVSRPASAVIKLPALQEGLYIVIVGADGKTIHKKVMMR